VSELVALGAEVFPLVSVAGISIGTRSRCADRSLEADDLLGCCQELKFLTPRSTRIWAPSRNRAGRRESRARRLASTVSLPISCKFEAASCEEPDPRPLPHVHKTPRPSAWIRRAPCRCWRRVAPARVEHVPGQALGMHRTSTGSSRIPSPSPGRAARGCRPLCRRRSAELTELGRELVVAIRRTSFSLVDPILDEVADRDHLRPCVRASSLSCAPGPCCRPRRAPRRSRRPVAAGQAGEVDRGLRVAAASQDPAGIARSGRMCRDGSGRRRAYSGSTSVRIVTRGRNGGPVSHPPRVDGDRERGAHRAPCCRDHHRDLEVIQALAEQRDADQAAACLA